MIILFCSYIERLGFEIETVGGLMMSFRLAPIVPCWHGNEHFRTLSQNFGYLSNNG